MMRQFDEQLTSGNQFGKIGVGIGNGDGDGDGDGNGDEVVAEVVVRVPLFIELGECKRKWNCNWVILMSFSANVFSNCLMFA